MWTMGTDFKYQYAHSWYKQTDKFIHYVNQVSFIVMHWLPQETIVLWTGDWKSAVWCMKSLSFANILLFSKVSATSFHWVFYFSLMLWLSSEILKIFFILPDRILDIFLLLIIWYVNESTGLECFQDGRVNALYSTPSIYTDAKYATNESWPLKTDDFFP